VPDTWIATLASGRSIEKLATFDTSRVEISPLRNASKRASRTFCAVCPVISGASSSPAICFNWSTN
jgi:hypothetical protein